MSGFHSGLRMWMVSLCFLFGSPVTHAAQDTSSWQFIHSQGESANDHRYDYHWGVLTAALDATQSKYGKYEIHRAEIMNEARQIAELSVSSGIINTMVLDSTSELEKALLPVKVPVDKGLLGYRVFLISSQNQDRFSKVKSLDDLRKFTIGQGSDWSDVAIFENAGFKVVKSTTYDGLFDMLMAGRFDAFGRGVTEVSQEVVDHQQRLSGLAIEKNVLLYYPMPVYFWFPKSKLGERYVQRVKEGMQIISANGLLDRKFKTQFGTLIQSLRLKDRQLFRIPNPDLPESQPFGIKQYWFNPLH